MGLFSGKSTQDGWDDQIAESRSADWRAAHLIANKMERCKHNPRNDGKGNDPYSVDDEDPQRYVADGRRWGMR